MGREIKFRFFSRFENKMHKITLLGVDNGEDSPVYVGENVWDPYLRSSRVQKYSDGHLMQYTGLKDCNGVEVYEGDITEHAYNKGTVCVIKYGEFMPDFLEDYWESLGLDPQPIMGFYAEVIKAMFGLGVGEKLFVNKNATFSVLGNIYEHRHLLEDKA